MEGVSELQILDPGLQVFAVPFRLPDMNEILDARSQRLVVGGLVVGDMYGKLKKRVEGEIRLCISASDVRPMESAYLTLLFAEQNRRRDPSNFVSGGLKVLEDALRGQGILPNDGWKNVLGFRSFWTVSERPGVLVLLSPTRTYEEKELPTWPVANAPPRSMSLPRSKTSSSASRARRRPRA